MENIRIPISMKMRKDVYKRDNHSCMKCGKKRYLEIHHIIPVYMGGKNSIENLITLCHACHKYAPDNRDRFDNFINSHYPPILDAMRKASYLTFMYILNIPISDLNKIKENPNDFYKNNFDKAFECIKDLLYDMENEDWEEREQNKLLRDPK